MFTFPVVRKLYRYTIGPDSPFRPLHQAMAENSEQGPTFIKGVLSSITGAQNVESVVQVGS